MNPTLKNYLKRLSSIGLEVNYALDSGLSIAGLNIGLARHPFAERSQPALTHCMSLLPGTVLDVGSGGGQHAAAFAAGGAQVTCIDFGTSVYAQRASTTPDVKVICADFGLWAPDKHYDLVWASHILEHQRNVGQFIAKLIACCTPGGRVAITVPFPHRHLWGGHLTLWTPGMLAYNVVLCGVDLSLATMLYGYRETSIVFTPKHIALPELTYDQGDLEKLRPFLPKGFTENADAWF